MEWTRQAEEAASRVPFFVRKRVKKKVEEEASRAGAHQVRIEHVDACQKRFLGNMDEEVRGYQVETCFGPGGCPNRAVEDEEMARRLEELLELRRLKAFLKDRVKGSLKLHHELRLSISDCPNGCSRPQIADVGLIGARRPQVVEENCTQCGACVDVCREKAIELGKGADAIVLDLGRCLACGQCLKVCPSGALRESARGYRVLVGGKLGRHPQLARELENIRSMEEAIATVERCVRLYMTHNQHGERFGEIINEKGTAGL